MLNACTRRLSRFFLDDCPGPLRRLATYRGCAIAGLPADGSSGSATTMSSHHGLLDLLGCEPTCHHAFGEFAVGHETKKAERPASAMVMTCRRRSASCGVRVTYPLRSMRTRTRLIVCSVTPLADAPRAGTSARPGGGRGRHGWRGSGPAPGGRSSPARRAARPRTAAGRPASAPGRGRQDQAPRFGTSCWSMPRLHLLFRRTAPMILSMLSNRRSTVLRAVLVGVALIVWLGIGSAGGMARES